VVAADPFAIQMKHIPGFTIKSGPPRETRLGARINAARGKHGLDSESSEILSARSALTKDQEGSLNAEDEAEIARQQTWLFQEKEKEARRVAQEEKENKLQNRKLALKLSKYKVELNEANKQISVLMDAAMVALQGPDLAELGIGLAAFSEGRAPTFRASSPSPPPQAAPRRVEEGFLANVRQLTAATMKISMRKKSLEEIVVGLRKEYVAEKSKFEVQLQEFQAQMAALRRQKENAEFALKDTRLNYEQRVKNLEQEMEDTRAQLAVLEVVNNQLSATCREQEGALFEVPRLEETYLRQARGIVLQKERKITAQTIQLKKSEKEVELTALWRNNASALGEETIAKDRCIAELRRQLIQLTHKHIALQNKYNAKEWAGAEKVVRTGNFLQTEYFSSPEEEGFVAHQSSSPPSSPKHYSGDDEKGRLAQTLQKSFLPADVEIERLKRQMAVLHRKLHRSNMALSNARAYPLLNMGQDLSRIDDPLKETTGGGDGVGGFNKKSEQDILDEMFDSDEDNEERVEMSAVEQAAEEKAQRELAVKRIERAIGVSTAYKAKLQQLRSSRPGVQHLKSLRRDD